MKHTFCILSWLVVMLCAGCGAPSPGDVTLTMRSGARMHSTLLAVDSNSAIIRTGNAPFADQMQSISLDSIVSVQRAGAVNGGAVWIWGVMGGAAGLGLGVALAPSPQPTGVVLDGQRMAFTLFVIPLLTAGFAALGALLGTLIHKPDRSYIARDPNFIARLRFLALYLNGLPTDSGIVQPPSHSR